MNRPLIVLLSLAVVSFAAEPSASDHKPELAKQVQKEQIYIPKDLEDCFRELDRTLRPEDIAKIRSGEITTSEMHFGLSAALRNSWGLWGKSRLAEYFVQMGILHPDDMSGIILRSYVRHLRNEPIKLEEQVAHSKEYWARSPPPSEAIIVKDLPPGTVIKPSKPYTGTEASGGPESRDNARNAEEKIPDR